MHADLPLENATAVTMNPRREILTGASVAISGEPIVDLGPTASLRA